MTIQLIGKDDVGYDDPEAMTGRWQAYIESFVSVCLHVVDEEDHPNHVTASLYRGRANIVDYTTTIPPSVRLHFLRVYDPNLKFALVTSQYEGAFVFWCHARDHCPRRSADQGLRPHLPPLLCFPLRGYHGPPLFVEGAC